MPYLIDGHNLIAQMPDIDLSDAHDEGKLIVRLRGFAAYKEQAITVVFDQGLPGGVDQSRSSKRVTVIFASSLGSTADAVIMGRIRKTRDASNWTVISSDNEVCDVARQHGMWVMRSHEFVAILRQRQAVRQQRPDPSEAIHPIIKRDETDELEALFEAKLAAEEKQPPVRRKRKNDLKRQ